MSLPSTPVSLCASAVIELEGHLIDSLTLARVLDLIQSEGGQYQVNDLKIGLVKADTSSATLTLFADNDKSLSLLIEKLQPYGIRLLGKEDAQLQNWVNGAPFSIRLPQSVQVNGKAVPITLDTAAQGDSEWVIAVSNNKARLTPKSQVKPDEQVIVGHQGIQWS